MSKLAQEKREVIICSHTQEFRARDGLGLIHGLVFRLLGVPSLLLMIRRARGRKSSQSDFPHRLL